MADIGTQIGVRPAIRHGGRRRLAIAVSMVLVLLAGLAALYMTRTVDQQLSDVATTYEVRRQAADLILAVVDAETGQRGYLITRDPSYLDPYKSAVARIDALYQRLLVLVGPDTTKGSQLKALKPSLDAKREEMAQTIALMSDGKLAEALALLRSDAGQNLMDTIRGTIGNFLAGEDQRLAERNDSVAAYRQGLVVSILGALAAAAVLAYALFSRTERQVATLAERQGELIAQAETLEAHVRERTIEVEEARQHAERERQRLEALLQDTNHRIGNSLATVSSLLGLQLARSNSDEVKSALEAAQARVRAIASSHRRLRLGDDLETTEIAEFLNSVVDDLATTVPAGKAVRFHCDVEPMVMGARDATTIGIVVGELVTNALKHAFHEGDSGQVWVRLRHFGDGGLALRVEDDGRGFVSAPDAGNGLGAVVIAQLARQFGGQPSYVARSEGGTSVEVSLPNLAVAA